MAIWDSGRDGASQFVTVLLLTTRFSGRRPDSPSPVGRVKEKSPDQTLSLVAASVDGFGFGHCRQQSYMELFKFLGAQALGDRTVLGTQEQQHILNGVHDVVQSQRRVCLTLSADKSINLAGKLLASVVHRPP
jgi:hypothetical protein